MFRLAVVAQIMCGSRSLRCLRVQNEGVLCASCRDCYGNCALPTPMSSYSCHLYVCVLSSETRLTLHATFHICATIHTPVKSLEYTTALQEGKADKAEIFNPKNSPPWSGAEADGAPGWALDTLYKEYVAAKGGSIPALQKMMGVQRL